MILPLTTARVPRAVGQRKGSILESVTIFLSFLSFFVALLALAISSVRLIQTAKTITQSSEIAKQNAELAALVQFRQSALASNFPRGIRLIEELEPDSYPEFEKLSPEDKSTIEDAVSHLNFVSNLIEAEHIDAQAALDIYFVSLRIVHTKLDPWWFVNIQKNHPNRYNTARRLAARVAQVSQREIDDFDRERQKRLDYILPFKS